MKKSHKVGLWDFFRRMYLGDGLAVAGDGDVVFVEDGEGGGGEGATLAGAAAGPGVVGIAVDRYQTEVFSVAARRNCEHKTIGSVGNVCRSIRVAFEGGFHHHATACIGGLHV